MSKIKSNIVYKVVGYNINNYRRYFELGFMIGSIIRLVRYSLLRKSMIICVDGISYSMRTTDAKDIEVGEV